MKMVISILVFYLFFGAQTATAARISFSLQETGTDILISFDGAVDITDLTLISTGGSATALISRLGIQSQIRQANVFEVSNALDTDFWDGNPPLSIIANTPLGDPFAINTDETNVFYFLDRDYVSGQQLSGTFRVSNQSISSLGLTPGFVLSQINADNELAITIGSTTPIPLPGGLPLFVTGLLAFGIVFRRNRNAA